MKFFKYPKKITWKVTLSYTALFILVLLILNSSIYLFFNNFIETNIKNSINNTLHFVLPQLHGIDRWNFDSYDANILETISESEGNIYFRILDFEGNIIAQSKFLENVNALPVEKGLHEVKGNNRSFVYKTVGITRSVFLSGYVQIIRDTRVESQFMDNLLLILILTAFLGGIGAVFIGYIVTRKTLKPISSMTETVRNISASDLGERLDTDGPDDELNSLAQTFNSMLDRLEEAFLRQQQFVSDASHELRTPISVIQGYADLLDRWGKNEAEIRDEAIGAIKNELKNIKELMESLLFLARGDSEHLKIKKEKLNFSDLLNEIARETEMIAENIKINTIVEDDIYFYGDRKFLKQLLRIFIDNSLKYISGQGEIKLAASSRKNKLEIIVEDTGCGIPAEDIPHIFERFYRVDKSRSGVKGIGLGLSIAEWIIDIHDGQVDVESEVDKGTKIKVISPYGKNQ